MKEVKKYVVVKIEFESFAPLKYTSSTSLASPASMVRVGKSLLIKLPDIVIGDQVIPVHIFVDVNKKKDELTALSMVTRYTTIEQIADLETYWWATKLQLEEQLAHKE